MADSFKIYPGDGVQTDFPITFLYLDPSHVKVAVDGVEVPFTISGGNAVVSPAPADGLAVRVYRESGAELLVDYTVGVLTEEDLDTAYRHALFVATEARDVAEGSIALDKDGKMEGNGRVIKNLGYPTNPEDAANKQYVDDRLAADVATVIANRNDALASRNAAASSQTAAANSASAAANSATNAAASATSANSSKNAAATSETNAASSASAAASSATNASNSANTATTQRGLAETARSDAQTARAGAEAARDAAIAARNTAETHKNAAATSATNASDSASIATTKAAEAAASAAAAATFNPDTYYSKTETDAFLDEKADLIDPRIVNAVRSDQTVNITAGYTASSIDDGVLSAGGSYQPAPADGNLRRIQNGGAFTFQAPTAAGDYTMVVLIENTAAPGAVTFSGFSKVAGDPTTVTANHRFLVFITKLGGFVLANVAALQ